MRAKKASKESERQQVDNGGMSPGTTGLVGFLPQKRHSVWFSFLLAGELFRLEPSNRNGRTYLSRGASLPRRCPTRTSKEPIQCIQIMHSLALS